MTLVPAPPASKTSLLYAETTSNFIFIDRPQSGSKFVFVLGFKESPSSDLELIGTVFAISTKYLLTAGHNFWNPNTNSLLAGQWFISRMAIKVNGKYVFDNPIEVIIKAEDQVDDWAVLEVASVAHYFLPDHWIPVCDVDELPDVDVVHFEIKSTYYPIMSFIRTGVVTLRAWPDVFTRVFQYDGTDNKTIIVDGGLVAGACGAPYI